MMKSMEIFTNYCSSDQMTALGLKTWLADKNYFSPDILNEQITIMVMKLLTSGTRNNCVCVSGE